MTKDEIIQKVTILRDASLQQVKENDIGMLGAMNMAAVLAYNTVLNLLEELEDCNNVTK
jgi:hypothetical protein